MTFSILLDKTVRLVWGIGCGLMAVLVFTDFWTMALDPGLIAWTGKGRPPIWYHSTLNYLIYDALKTAWFALGFTACFMRGRKVLIPHIVLTVAVYMLFR